MLLLEKKIKSPTEQLLLIAKAYLNLLLKKKLYLILCLARIIKNYCIYVKKLCYNLNLVIIEKFKKGKRFKLTAKGSAITAWSMIHGIAVTLNNSKKKTLESLWNIELENILGEMSAIWEKELVKNECL